MMKSLLFSLCSLALFHISAFAQGQTADETYRLPKEAVEALSTGTEFVLYSLDPGPLSVVPPHLKPEEDFNGFKTIGYLRLTDPKSRAIAVTAVTDAIHAADYHFIALCFSPRHALRVTAGDEVFDFIICYQCGQIRLYQKGRRVAIVGIPSHPEALNKILSDRGIPLGTPPVE